MLWGRKDYPKILTLVSEFVREGVNYKF